MIKFFKILLISWFLLFQLSCSNDALETTTDNSVGTIELFNKTKLPTIEIEISEQQWNQLLANFDQNAMNDERIIANFSYSINNNNAKLDSIGLKLKGNTSRRRPEGNFGQLHNSTNPDYHHAHFAFDFDFIKPNQQLETLNRLDLKWFKDDAMYVRELYCYDLFERFGVWTAPKSSYCKLYIKIKGEQNTAYFGVYEMLEHIDKKYIEKRSQNWTSTVGNIWKCGWSGNTNADFVNTNSIGIENINLNSSLSQTFTYDLKTNQANFVNAQSQLVQFINDLNSKTGTDFENWISQKMDVDLFLKTYAVNVAVGMWDDYWCQGNNFYFYFDPNGKAYYIPYDFDNTLGTSHIMSNSGTQNPLFWSSNFNRPLISKILAIPQYNTKYLNYLKQLANPNNDFLDQNKSISRISAWQNLIQNHIANDTFEDNSIQDVPANWGNCGFYRLKSGNNLGGSSGDANFFATRCRIINQL